MSTHIEFPTVRRPLVLMLFAVFVFYLAMATALGQSARPATRDGRPVAAVAGDSAYLPIIYKADPLIQYFKSGGPYMEVFWIGDSGLVAPGETLSVQVNGPPGLTVDQSSITGPRKSAGTWVVVSAPKLPAGHARLNATILVDDVAGHRIIHNYEIFVADPAPYDMSIQILNTLEGFVVELGQQELRFGLGGDGCTSGSEAADPGRLDTAYCEYELPPAPPLDAFDARWEIPARTGVFWNFYPEHMPDDQTAPAWNFVVQPGRTRGRSNLPISISWAKSDAAAFPRPLYLSDRGGTIFRVNMATGERTTSLGVEITDRDGSITVSVPVPELTLFKIEQGTSSGVAEHHAAGAARIGAYPNPSSGAVEIRVTAADARRAQIFDARGGLVRTLDAGEAASGGTQFAWDGKDGQGADCASGIYRCRVTAGEGSLAVPIVIAR